MSIFDPRRAPFSPGAPEAGRSGKLVAALDVGAAKVVCLLAREAEGGRPEIIGVGAQKPQAGANGAPLDFDACARAIRIAIDEAERMAGETAGAVVAGFSGKGLSSRRLIAEVALPPGPVGLKETRAALARALAEGAGPGRVLLHAAPLGYRVDGGPLAPDPRGAEGKRLGVEVTLVTAPAETAAALVDCIAEAGLRTARLVASPYAAGLAVLSPQECALGGIVLDFGASHVGVAAFAEGGLVLAEHVPIGGAALTAELAARLGANFAAAERVKILYGDLAAVQSDAPVEAPRLGPDGRLEAALTSRGAVVEAVGPQLDAILTLVRARLEAIRGWEGRTPWRAALTGGGGMFPGLLDIGAHALARPLRLGRPVGFGALDAGPAAASYAAAAGLLRYALDQPAEALGPPQAASPASAAQPFEAPFGGAVGRALSWLRENF